MVPFAPPGPSQLPRRGAIDEYVDLRISEQAGTAPLNSEIVSSARARFDDLMHQDVGYNISPLSWDAHSTIGATKTFLTDRPGALGYFGDLAGKTEITIPGSLASTIEQDVGLYRGSLQDGFKIREVQGIGALLPAKPVEGNARFQGYNNHLPGGAPEMIVRPIPTVDNSTVTTVLTVKVRK